VRTGLQDELPYGIVLLPKYRQLIAEQVLETGTKTITPEDDPLLCEAGTYGFTRIDQAEEVAIELGLWGFPPDSVRWELGWWTDPVSISEGDVTLSIHPSYVHRERTEVLDVSLHSGTLILRSHLATPDKTGVTHAKVARSVDISVTAQLTQPSGFVLQRRFDLTVSLETERTDLDARYQEDVNFCYFLRTMRGIDEGTQQPPWIDPSDPMWRRNLGEELVRAGRLPSGAGEL
jgi:hypothetical protein